MTKKTRDEGDTGTDTAPADPRRRRFMRDAAMLAGAAAAPGAVGSALAAGKPEPLAVPSWTTQQGSPILTPAYGMPSKFEKDVVRRPTDLTPTDLSSWSFTPLQDLNGMITPNGLVYERHHGGVPAIHPSEHRLVVHGLVEQPLMFTIDELMRFPQVSMIRFLECSGNTLTEWKSATGTTVQDTHGLLSCCEWTGVPLSTVLKEAGVQPEGKWILAEGADAAAMTRSIPMDKAMDDALLCYAQNGEALRPEQGYPLRLILPGYEGNTQIKWLRRLEVGSEPYMTREETSKYTDLMPDGTARQFTYIMEAKSVITSPSGGQRVGGKGFHEIRGLAWSGRGRITRVDVSVDGGRNWETAELDDPVLPRCVTRFRLPWRWSGAEAVLQSRAIDETGYVQPTREQLIDARGLDYVYHYNGIQSWHVAPDGEVTNVHA
ncbi:hypothetical protein KBTX_00681 [wastewater metagenome]|uniref:Oxidoreductase molybdopterin binding domain n=2 Tax=unclassified sequences TaxID=12908 RepID=A0A5B8R8S5_9ZZZZ|nr:MULTISPECIES: sulfite dehydrogenase [Arhodomonas]MCS4502545.1 sulfite dehydrogenase [Arhodomonas aquaeolei]QEA04373.1 hypothetical protein KBTEX_00681 [uncultured organism]